MKKSEVLQKDREDMMLLYKRMKPEEKLVAYWQHSQLIYQMYQAGLDYRAGRVPPSGQQPPHKR